MLDATIRVRSVLAEYGAWLPDPGWQGGDDGDERCELHANHPPELLVECRQALLDDG